MDILVLWFVTWCALQLLGAKEPARTIILVLGILIALLGTFWLHWPAGHPIR